MARAGPFLYAAVCRPRDRPSFPTWITRISAIGWDARANHESRFLSEPMTSRALKPNTTHTLNSQNLATILFTGRRNQIHDTSLYTHKYISGSPTSPCQNLGTHQKLPLLTSGGWRLLHQARDQRDGLRLVPAITRGDQEIQGNTSGRVVQKSPTRLVGGGEEREGKRSTKPNTRTTILTPDVTSATTQASWPRWQQQQQKPATTKPTQTQKRVGGNATHHPE